MAVAICFVSTFRCNGFVTASLLRLSRSKHFALCSLRTAFFICFQQTPPAGFLIITAQPRGAPRSLASQFACGASGLLRLLHSSTILFNRQ